MNYSFKSNRISLCDEHGTFGISIVNACLWMKHTELTMSRSLVHLLICLAKPLRNAFSSVHTCPHPPTFFHPFPLTRYTSNFAANDIDGLCLREGLDDETLQQIGVSLPVHRRKLHSAVHLLFPLKPDVAGSDHAKDAQA